MNSEDMNLNRYNCNNGAAQSRIQSHNLERGRSSQASSMERMTNRVKDIINQTRREQIQFRNENRTRC